MTLKDLLNIRDILSSDSTSNSRLITNSNIKQLRSGIIALIDQLGNIDTGKSISLDTIDGKDVVANTISTPLPRIGDPRNYLFRVNSAGEIVCRNLISKTFVEAVRLRLDPDVTTAAFAPGELRFDGIDLWLWDGFIWKLLSGGGGGAENNTDIMNYIPVGTEIDVPVNFQYTVYGNLIIDGTLINNGQVVIINGGLVLQGAGMFINVGTGSLIEVDLTTNNKYIANFNTVANVPLTITHNMSTTDFTYSIKEGSNIISASSGMQLDIVDANSITITTFPGNVSGRIVLIAA